MTTLRTWIWLVAGWLLAGGILCAYGTTYTAASANESDVQAKLNLTVDGDTVQIPGGNATWTTTMSPTNSITIIGATSGTPTVISNATGSTVFNWKPVNNLPLRLAYLDINSPDSANYIIQIAGPSFATRVDHCNFNKGTEVLVFNPDNGGGGVIASGAIYGVVDHNNFTNCARTFYVCDRESTDSSFPPHPSGNNWSGATEWSRSILPGTTNMMYYEDNYIEINASYSNPISDGTTIYGQGGGKRCFRHNTFKGSRHWIDMHGDNPDYSVNYYEIYSNTFNDGSYGEQDQTENQRGGVVICYNNIVTNNNDGLEFAALLKYWSTDIYTVSNSYYWGNLEDGNQVTWGGTAGGAHTIYLKDSGQCGTGCTAAAIALNNQVFTNAPQSGQTFYPYTPLVYPHPLVSGTVATNPPSGIPPFLLYVTNSLPWYQAQYSTNLKSSVWADLGSPFRSQFTNSKSAYLRLKFLSNQVMGVTVITNPATNQVAPMKPPLPLG